MSYFDDWWDSLMDAEYSKDYGLHIKPRDSAELAWNAAINEAKKIISAEYEDGGSLEPWIQPSDLDKLLSK